MAALSDDIAYNSHDIDDGFRAGLFTLDDVCQVPMVGKTCNEIMATYPNLSEDDLIREAIRRLINGFVYDLRQETQRRLADLKPQSVEDVRNLKVPLVALSDGHMKNLKEIHAFLTEYMYYHAAVTAMKAAGRAIVRDLYAIEKHRHYSPEGSVKAEDIADKVAILTDHEALIAHEKLTGRKYVSPLTPSKQS